MLKDNQWLKVRIQSGLLVFALYERKYGILWAYKQAHLTIIEDATFLSFTLDQLQLKLADVMETRMAEDVWPPLAVIEHGGNV